MIDRGDRAKPSAWGCLKCRVATWTELAEPNATFAQQILFGVIYSPPLWWRCVQVVAVTQDQALHQNAAFVC